MDVAQKIRKSQRFIDLCHGELNLVPTIDQFVKSRGLKSAIDLGCEDGLALWFLHHQFEIQFLTGIEYDTQEELVDRLNNSGNCKESIVSIFQRYQNEFTTSINAICPKITKSSEFDARFNYVFKEGIIPHLAQCNAKFDVVICSNVLHYIRQRESDLRDCFLGIDKIASDNALIYIRINELLEGKRNPVIQSFDDYKLLATELLSTDRKLEIFENVVPNSRQGRAITITNIPLLSH